MTTIEGTHGRMMVHCGARLATLEQIEALPAPPSLGRYHKPVHHAEFIYALLGQLQERGIAIGKQAFAIGGTRTWEGDDITPAMTLRDTGVFAYLDVTIPGIDADPDYSFGLAARSDNAMRVALRIAAGLRVFACDNLAVSGTDIVLCRRHTLHLDLQRGISEGLDRYIVECGATKQDTDRLKSTHVSDRDAESVLYRIFAKKRLPLRLLPEAHANFFELPFGDNVNDAEVSDVAPRTLWGVANALTRTIRGEPLPIQLRHSQAIDVAFRTLK